MRTIYRIECKADGRAYIGQTATGLGTRWKAHLRSMERGDPRPLYAAMREHGAGAFTIEEIDRADDAAETDVLETSWILTAGTLHPSGFNLTTRPQGAMRGGFSPQARERIRAATVRRWANPAAKEACCAAISRGMSEEGRARIAEATRKRWQDPEIRAALSKAISQARRRDTDAPES